MGQSVLSKSFAVSLVVHSGLLGLLVLIAKPPGSLDKPLQVRLVEPPPVAAPLSPPVAVPQPVPQPLRRAVPQAAPVPPARRGSSERESRGERIGRPEGSGISRATRGAQEAPASPSPPLPAPALPVPEVTPPPQVAARPAPEAVPPPAEVRREFREEPQPERSGLSLGGPPREVRLPPAPTSPAPRTRPPLRDQIAGLGSGLTADPGGSARRTVPLDSQEPRFLDYLARLKRHIQGEWMYPEEARRVGMGGELVVVFTLNRAGTLTYIRLLESSGFPILDDEAIRAIKAAAPFDPFPPQMGDEPWNISAIFRYYSPYSYRRN